MNEVANGIAGREDVEIAVIPRGTGWDFARTYKIPHKLDGAVDVALTGRARTIDLGRATLPRLGRKRGRRPTSRTSRARA